MNASDQKVWYAANEAITKYGGAAWMYAATFAREAREIGDTDQEQFWLLVAGVIAKMEDLDLSLKN